MQVLKPEVRQKVLEAAQILFLEHGFEKTTMNAIATKSKISKSNLYNYFSDKEALFRELTDVAAVQFTNLIDFFANNEFSPVFGEIAFPTMMYTKILDLINSNKEGLILLVDSAVGTPYESLVEDLTKKISDKFQRDYVSKASDKTLLVDVVSKNLFIGIIDIVKLSSSDKELELSLKDFINYHLKGFLIFIE